MSARASTPGRRRRDDRGSSAVEFALLLLPLMLILFGIVSFGFMLSFRQGVSQAAAEGARAAAVQVDDSLRDDDGRAAIGAALEPYGVSCNASGQLVKDSQTVGVCSVSDQANCAGSSTQKCVTVTVRYSYREHPMIISPPLVGNLLPENLEYVSTVRVS